MKIGIITGAGMPQGLASALISALQASGIEVEDATQNEAGEQASPAAEPPLEDMAQIDGLTDPIMQMRA